MMIVIAGSKCLVTIERNHIPMTSAKAAIASHQSKGVPSAMISCEQDSLPQPDGDS